MLEILLVDGEQVLRDRLEERLVERGHHVETADDGAAGAECVGRRMFDVVICDLRLPQVDGLALFRKLRREAPGTDVILMTACSEVSQAVSALKEGAYDYLTKPFDLDELLLQVRRIDEVRSLRRELDSARTALGDRPSSALLVGQAPAIRRIQEMVKMVAHSDAPALITGESGTGKEVVARMVHEQSARRDSPFIAVNCGAVAENLVEAELFGHERGVFPGALRKRDGRFKAADGGTLLLDEIAELPLPTQAKLLRVLQEGTVEPLGTNTPVRVDVRIISATHRDLRERIKAGLFREDLFHRLNVVELRVPPLRERTGDIPLLVNHFLARMTPAGAASPTISPEAWAALSQYAFPGNVRELSHAIQHAMVLSGGKEIGLRHLPQGMLSSNGAEPREVELPTNNEIRPLQAAVRDFEHAYLLRALRATEGKRARTAELLGISRKTLWEKLRSDADRAASASRASWTPPEDEAIPSS
jgi:DNA-binding NtrC family response regulator